MAKGLTAVRRGGSALALACLALCWAGVAAAQTQQVFPRETLEPQVPERPPGPDADAPVIGERPEAPPPAPAGGPSFMLQGIRFEGATAYDDATLLAELSDFVGREVTFTDLRAITDRIERRYRDDGYVAVRAVVPAQRIQGGVIGVRVIEGAIAEIALRGDIGRAEPEVRRLLEELVGLRPLTAAAAERQILLARDLPGVNLITALRARESETPGELVLLVEGTVAPLDGFLSFSNFASEFAGPYIVTAGGGANSVALAGDRIEGVLLTSLDIGEEFLGQITYEAPLGVSGLRGRITGSNSISETGGALEILDIDYRSRIVRGELEYAIIRRRARSLYATGGLEVVHQESNALISSIAVDENLTVLYGGARYIETSLAGGRLDATAGIRIGLDALGANSKGDPNLTGNAETDPQFVSGAFQARYDRALPADLSLAARMRAQVSSGDLPTFERFSLGNYTIGRGFDPGSVTGDHGLAASLELAWRPPFPEIAAITPPQIFGFVEGGRAYSDDGDAGLASAGFGARVQILDRFDAEAFLAFPFASSDFIGEDDVSGLIRLTAFF